MKTSRKPACILDSNSTSGTKVALKLSQHDSTFFGINFVSY